LANWTKGGFGGKLERVLTKKEIKMKQLALLIILSALLITGCSHNLSMEHSTLDMKIELDKSQYEIVGDIQGEATTRWFLLVYIPIPLETSPNFGSLEYPGIFYRGATEKNAMYNAIKNSGKDVDYIIAPKFDTELSGFPPFYWVTTVKVTGKGIKLIEG
jgi:hypothetical protein